MSHLFQNQIFQQRIERWFGRRMPVGDTIRLQQKSTYILPTKAGFLLFAIILLMLIGATNYQNNLAFLLTFLILSIGLVSILFSFRNLQGLIVKLGALKSAHVGQKLQFPVCLLSQANQSHFTIGVGFSKATLQLCDVLIGCESQMSLSIKVIKRGWYQLPRILASSRFPFGLMHVWTWFQFESPVLIYPKPIQPPPASKESGQDEQEGSTKMAGNDDLYGLKIYQPGEPMSRIDWKALARERGLFSKEFVAYQSQTLVFDWDDFPATEPELRLSYLCFLVVEASKNNFEFSLRLAGTSIANSSGNRHTKQCLEALALFGLE